MVLKHRLGSGGLPFFLCVHNFYFGFFNFRCDADSRDVFLLQNEVISLVRKHVQLTADTTSVGKRLVKVKYVPLLGGITFGFTQALWTLAHIMFLLCSVNTLKKKKSILDVELFKSL